jgi:DNA-binding transcriptional MerR regulator
VANETGLSIDTIRFYEKQGLLKRSPRTEDGFRLFGAGDIETLSSPSAKLRNWDSP